MELIYYFALAVIMSLIFWELRQRKSKKPVKVQKILSKEEIISLIKQEKQPSLCGTRYSEKYDEKELWFFNLKKHYDNQVTISLKGDRGVNINGQRVYITAQQREACLFGAKKLRNDTIRDYGIDLAKLEIQKTK